MAYKFTIDTKALTKFFTEDKPPMEAINAAKMVVTTVIIKHFVKYMNLEEDLKSLCFCAMLERKAKYDLSYSAYNYAYTICRNEIGNYLHKRREVVVEDILPMLNTAVDTTSVQLPSEISKYHGYLTGEKSFTVLELSERDAINLSIFCELYNPSRKINPPEFIPNNTKVIALLYRLLLKV